MNRQPVTSSNLKSVGYAAGTLQIEFQSGRVYDFYDVSPATHLALMNAESVGVYFNDHIRDRYETREVIAEAQPDFDALVNGIAAWQDEDKRGVYLDHAKRLYALGITDVEMLRALLTTLYQTAVANEAAVVKGPTPVETQTIHERINYRAGAGLSETST